MKKDGKQTPMKGHPVFIAQHATATCFPGLYSEVASDKERKGLADQEIQFFVELIDDIEDDVETMW